MQATAISFALLLLMASNARADEAWKDCADFQNEAASTLRAVQACSDAIYQRQDVEEADAICKGADAILTRATDAYHVLRADPADKERAACAVENRATAVRLVGALDWLASYNGFRIDRHKNPLPRPFAG